MTEPRIRRAVASDLATINALAEDMQATHADHYPELFVRTGMLPYWEKSLDAADHAVFVAERDGIVIGVALAQLMDETSPSVHPMKYCRLNVIAVDAKARGAGVGRLLIETVEAFACEAGAQEIRLSVADFNHGAIGVYEHLGYKIRTHVMGKRIATSD